MPRVLPNCKSARALRNKDGSNATYVMMTLVDSLRLTERYEPIWSPAMECGVVHVCIAVMDYASFAGYSFIQEFAPLRMQAAAHQSAITTSYIVLLLMMNESRNLTRLTLPREHKGEKGRSSHTASDPAWTEQRAQAQTC